MRGLPQGGGENGKLFLPISKRKKELGCKEVPFGKSGTNIRFHIPSDQAVHLMPSHV